MSVCVRQIGKKDRKREKEQGLAKKVREKKTFF
jgi:hypothetical protein